MLGVPFRRTHPTHLAQAIEGYISHQYDQHPNMFRDDLREIDRLRNDAVQAVEVHVSGVSKITAYAAQLVWISGKFPIDMGVEFVWYTCLGYNTQQALVQDNLRFEQANILCNLSALYSQLALTAARNTSDGLKSACNYFCRAAGVISHIKDKVLPELRCPPPEDMDVMTLECLQHLLLAQGQECFWSKAVMDGLKDATVAKLAVKTSDFYDQAAEFGTKSDVISTDWIHHMTAKHHHFAAAAQYRASRECLERQAYGEEIARLRDGFVCVGVGLKESRWISKTIIADLNSLKGRLSDDLKRAEKDNDVIYLMPVPSKAELKALSRAGMATARVPDEIADPYAALGDRSPLGRPLFARLVPYAVHVAASIYEERKDRLVKRSLIGEIENLSNRVRDLLRSLNLPGTLQALDRPLGLPSALAAHADELRQQDGIHRVRRSMYDTQRMKESDVSMYEEGVKILQGENENDQQARAKHGNTRWNRPVSTRAADKLYAQVQELDSYLKSAAKSDELVVAKLKENERVIVLLSGNRGELEDSIPNARRTKHPREVEAAANDLRTALNEVGRLEHRRGAWIGRVRDKARLDDINDVILEETARLEREHPMQKIEPAQFEDLFEQRLQRYNEDAQTVSKEARLQEALMEELQAASSQLTEARQGDQSTRDRERALQDLENGYVKYQEICENIETGREFYNRLAKIVTDFRDECRGFAYQRRLEARQLEGEIESSMSALSLSPRARVVQQDQQYGSIASDTQHSSPQNYQYQSKQNQHQPGFPTAQHQSPQSDPYQSAKQNAHQHLPSSNQGAYQSGIPRPIPATTFQDQNGPNSLLERQTLPAPIPTRVTPAQHMWTPEAGIKFGAPSPQKPTSAMQDLLGDFAEPLKPGVWDARDGVHLKQ